MIGINAKTKLGWRTNKRAIMSRDQKIAAQIVLASKVRRQASQVAAITETRLSPDSPTSYFSFFFLPASQFEIGKIVMQTDGSAATLVAVA